MKYLILTLFFLTFANTNTCNNKNAKVAQNETSKAQTAKENKFHINELNGKDISSEKLYIIINEELNTISGYSGCNTFSCKYTEEKETMALGFPIASKMYCPNKNEIEKDFLKTLIEVKTKVIEEESLFLKNEEGIILFSGTKSNE